MNLLDIKPHKVTQGTLGKHFLIYGPPSTRKTTVASNFPKPLLLATEVGYSFIENVKAINIESWYQFREAVEQLKRQEVRDTYDTIVIDTLSLLSEQCVTYVNNKLGIKDLSEAGWGKGWKEYKKEMSTTFNLIAQKGYGIVFIAHSKEERNDEGELTGAQPGIDNSTLNIVNPLVDFVFFLNKEESEPGIPSVFAYSGLSKTFLTKSRVRGLEKRIEFTYDNLESAIIDAISKSGVETAEKVERDYTPKATLEELKTSINEYAVKAKDLGVLGQAEAIVKESLGSVTISQATQYHYDKLEAINLAIRDLVSG